ncbi:MAG: nicotinate-nucleotide adenylyltransferase [Desulfomonile sp.]|nr:nicotinate-nucleotide adenylyltransferase [Desulfomonile sp.]
MKLGILGGSFNPPHLGHLRLAEEAAFAHDLDRIMFVPSSLPPHKSQAHMASPAHRIEMTRLACRDNLLFEVSDMELRRGGPSYTVKTLEALEREGNRDHFFILGSDSLREISTWKEYERLFQLCNFIVVQRPGVSFEAAWTEVPAAVRDRFHHEGDGFVSPENRLIIPSHVCGLDISSTRIRSLVREGRSIRYLVTEPVRAYIEENYLYRR